MPKESFVELVAEKRCLFRPTAGHFNYQWWWVMQRDFPPLPLSSHPIWLWWQWDFGDRSISQSTLLSSSKMNVARTRVGSENSGSSCRQTPNSCSGEPHEGALSPSKNDIPIRESPSTFSLRTSPLQSQRDLLFSVSTCQQCWSLVPSFSDRRWEPQAAGSPCTFLAPELVP